MARFARERSLRSGVALALALGAAAGCSSASSQGGDAGLDGASAKDVGVPEGYVPIPKTLACTGETTACLSGTLALKDFTALPSATKVTLYHLFPHGDVEVIASTPVAFDGTFAFSHLDAWGHYYLQGEARFGEGASATAVVTNVGSFAVPSSKETIAIVIRPVLLEVLQQAPSGGATLLDWASAHLFDPRSGAELTTGTVTLTAGGKTFPMPYGPNVDGASSFNVNLPSGTPGATSFTITTSFAGLPGSKATWSLVGDPATFGGAIVSPTAGTVPEHAALAVTWQAQPMASYSQTELFVQQGSTFTTRYVSPTVNAPDVTSETIPASAFSSSGAYLLNEEYSNATCPASSDGCVYNLSTAAENLTVQ